MPVLLGSTVQWPDGRSGSVAGVKANRPWHVDVLTAGGELESTRVERLRINGESFTALLQRCGIEHDRAGWHHIAAACGEVATPGQPKAEAARPADIAPRALSLGKVKWFGGFNNKTGRPNEYGFLDNASGDVYVHRSDVLCPAELLVEGAEVVLEPRDRGSKGLSAHRVRTVGSLSGKDVLALLKGDDRIEPVCLLALCLRGATFGPRKDDVLEAVTHLAERGGACVTLDMFWRQFPPASIDDPFFPLAPSSVKEAFCKQHYAGFLDKVTHLFDSMAKVVVSVDAAEEYLWINERDKALADIWAHGQNKLATGEKPYPGVVAQMRSARVAETVAAGFYRRRGLDVDDVSIRQLDARSGGNWTTHDLLVDGRVAVDVKNARRPANSKAFYVEHTIPRFKRDRHNHHVRYAGVLSPYVNLKDIEAPPKAKLEDIVFLGETSLEDANRLAEAFRSPSFELPISAGRTVPHWWFNYPEAWYRAFAQDLAALQAHAPWPEGEHWHWLFPDAPTRQVVPALCAAGKPLPDMFANRLPAHLQAFYARVQRLTRELPALPAVFLCVLTDALEHIASDTPDYSPADYRSILFAGRLSKPWPLGIIDPLGIVESLIETLSTLWENRAYADLSRFKSYRFTGLGLLQGQECIGDPWTTIIAYCGGNIYAKNDEGEALIDASGEPIQKQGKCGSVPLVIGRERTCKACRRLVCQACGFCSDDCQKKYFRQLAAERRARTEQAHQRALARAAMPAGFDIEIPISAYADEFSRR